MHGGFSEDAATGKVYTGIPGAGLYEITADLTSWRQIGSDPRLRDNIHGVCVFKHEGTTSIALAQNEAQRVLIVGLDGRVQQELRCPRGGEFTCAAANHFYSKRREDKGEAGKKFAVDEAYDPARFVALAICVSLRTVALSSFIVALSS